MSVQDKVVADILAARERANAVGNGIQDNEHTPNDWVAFTLAYLGRASRGVFRNDRQDEEYRDNLVKAGGLIVSALVAYDREQNRKALQLKAAELALMPETAGERATA